MKHCDDYIRDKTQPRCLRKWLLYKRIPAYWQMKYWKDSWGVPTLFATNSHPLDDKLSYMNGHRVRVNMASRFGDVGITASLTRENGYDARVYLSNLKDFSETP